MTIEELVCAFEDEKIWAEPIMRDNGISSFIDYVSIVNDGKDDAQLSSFRLIVRVPGKCFVGCKDGIYVDFMPITRGRCSVSFSFVSTYNHRTIRSKKAIYTYYGFYTLNNIREDVKEMINELSPLDFDGVKRFIIKSCNGYEEE